VQNLKPVLIPLLGTLAALGVLAASYYLARGTPQQYPPPAESPNLPLLGGTMTPEPMNAFLTPRGVERGGDGRYIAPDLDQPRIIPDNSRDGAVSRIFVPDQFTVGSVRVLNLEVQHDDTSELVVRLLAPDLTLVPLVQGLCPRAHNWKALSLDDKAAKALGSECLNNLNDFYHPPPEHRLAQFSGAQSRGDWVLSVTDTRGGNVGYLRGWALLFTASVTGTATLPASPVHGTPPASAATPARTGTPAP